MSPDSPSEQGPSPELQAAPSDVLSRAAELLETTPEDITIINQDETVTGRGRWAFGFTERDRGFFKYALKSNTSIRLAQEIQAMKAAQSVGIPTVEILRGYKEDGVGKGIMMLRA